MPTQLEVWDGGFTVDDDSQDCRISMPRLERKKIQKNCIQLLFYFRVDQGPLGFTIQNWNLISMQTCIDP